VPPHPQILPGSLERKGREHFASRARHEILAKREGARQVCVDRSGTRRNKQLESGACIAGPAAEHEVRWAARIDSAAACISGPALALKNEKNQNFEHTCALYFVH
jgi:hypothetical protein